MQIACDVIYSRILNANYILQSEKYLSNHNKQNIFKIHTGMSGSIGLEHMRVEIR